MRLLFDLETDGLLDVVTKIHSLVIIDIDTNKMYSCCDQHGYLSIQEGVELLKNADQLIGHNIIGFDYPVIKKLYGVDLTEDVYDTYNAAAVMHTDIDVYDYQQKMIRNKKLIGSHKLEAWGERLGIYKGDFGKDTDWKNWSKEMQTYCEQDCHVTLKLFDHLMSKHYSKDALKLEFRFQKYLSDQQINGVPFDIESAKELSEDLKLEKLAITHKIHALIPPKTIYSEFIPKTSNKTRGYVKGVPVKRKNVEVFNPGSRKQILEFLQSKYQWKPSILTKKGNPELGAAILDTLPWKEAELFSTYFNVNNILSKVSGGKESWLKHCKNGRIHGRVIASGAVTFRCTHSSPNLSQVTSERKYKGAEARKLFYAPEGLFIGADASGLELRNLAHYLYPYDGGKFVEKVLHGDIHTSNKEDAGLESRDQAKRFIYAFNYGAGDELLGDIVDPSLSKEQKKRIGKDLRSSFLSKNPAIKSLLRDLEAAITGRDYLIGLKGYKIRIREKYRLLNSLLQAAGAVIMKQATVNFMDDMIHQKLYNTTVFPALHVHDEIQVICLNESMGDSVGMSMVEGIRKTTQDVGFKCPLDGEYNIGKNWGETH